MNTILRKGIVVMGVALILAVLIVGTYFPYRKSRAIVAMRTQLSGVATVERFLGVFEEALALYSPYGQEEAVRFIGEQLGGAISVQGDPRVTNAIVAYAEKIFAPLLTASGGTPPTAVVGSGSSPAKNLLFLGGVHQAAWTRTSEAVYANRSEELYLRCLEASPRRPECLYALFRLYESGGRNEQAKLIGEEILRYWPDERVRELLENSK
ncbi:MAG: hypothetical protein HY475_01790 [Candidatus Terrybacteria bacterium]|nr:hypothetical protein [Candidatus Terrybacteria bacterium]